MPQYTEQFTEIHQPLDFGIYQVLSPGNHYTPYVALNDFHRAFFHVFVGNMGPAAEITIYVMQATTVAGAGAKLQGKWATQLDQDQGEAISHIAIELQTEELDVDGGFDCVALWFDVDDNPVEITWTVWGVCPRYPPVPTTFWHQIVQ